MSVYANPAIDDVVKVDKNHAEFVRSLVLCKKPKKVLELGFGSGESTRAILEALRYNKKEVQYTVVDNWIDFNGVRPSATFEPQYEGVNFITSSEYEFVKQCSEQYEFIFSDADHHNTQLWFHRVYEQMLTRNGVLIYHDVTNVADFPNLLQIYKDTIQHGYSHVLMNLNSLPEERCDRGLLVIFKN